MSDKSYMEKLGEISSTAKSASYAADIVAAMTPPERLEGAEMPASTAAAPQQRSVGKAVLGLAPGVVAGGIGAVMWGEHRVLGFLSGHAVGSNVGAIMRGTSQERREGYCRLGIESAGIVGSLMLKKKMHPVFGWMTGVVAGAVVTSFVPGSPMKTLRTKLFNK